jgi:hypothetical protein
MHVSRKISFTKPIIWYIQSSACQEVVQNLPFYDTPRFVFKKTREILPNAIPSK